MDRDESSRALFEEERERERDQRGREEIRAREGIIVSLVSFFFLSFSKNSTSHFFPSFFSLPPTQLNPTPKNRHHPDVGGAPARFLKVAEAYALLTGRGNRGRGGKGSSSSHSHQSSSSSTSSSWSFHDFFWSFSAQRRSSWAARKARERAGGVFESIDEDRDEDGEGGERGSGGFSGFHDGNAPPPPPPSSGPALRAALNRQLAGLRLRAARRRAAGGGSASAARAEAGKPRERGREVGGEEGEGVSASSTFSNSSSSSPSSSHSESERTSPQHFSPPPAFFYVAEGAAPGDSATCEEAREEGKENENYENDLNGNDENDKDNDSHHHQQQTRRRPSSSFVGDAEARRRQLAGLRRKSAIRRGASAPANASSRGQRKDAGQQGHQQE